MEMLNFRSMTDQELENAFNYWEHLGEDAILNEIDAEWQDRQDLRQDALVELGQEIEF